MAIDSFKVKKSLNIQPTASPSLTEQGDLAVDSATGKLSYRNASTASPLVAEAHTATLTNKTIDADLNTISNLVDASIKAGAAIAYSKLNLSNSIVNADIASAAAIAYSKLSLSNSIVNADIASAAAIAYSKLALSNSIVNADIATGAAIALDKLAATTADRALVSNGSGVITPSAVTATELGYVSGVTSSIQTQLGNKADTSALTAHTGASSGVHGVTGSVVGTSDTQTLTNKTLDLPVIDNGADFIEENTLANPASGRRRLGLKTDGKLYLRDSSGNEVAVGTGSGGGINYILNPDAEANTTGWNTYNDSGEGSTTQPVNGTSGSANITFTRDTTTPLRNTAQFLLTKPVNSQQGQGVSYDFTIDRADQAKRLTISFDYLVASGTYADGDIGVYIVDVTNGTVIQPAGFQVQNISGVAGKELATFQTASNSTSYRLCLHVASTSTSAYTLRIDNVQVGPVNATFSTPVTDWVSYTPTGSWTANTTYAGRWRQVGDTREYQVRIALSGAPTAATLTVNLPSGHVIDTARLASGTNTDIALPGGDGTYLDSGSFLGIAKATYNNTTSVQVRATTVANPHSLIQVTQASPITFASGDSIDFTFTVPIVGLSASAQVVSDSSEGRVVAARARTATAGSYPNAAATIVDFNTVDFDTVGAVTTGAGWRFTARVPGRYQVSAAILTDITTANGACELVLFRNGSRSTALCVFTNKLTSSRYELRGSTSVTLSAGDYIDIRFDNNSGGTRTLVTDGSYNYVDIALIQGSQTLLGGETVAASLSTSTTNTSNDAETLITFTNTDYNYAGTVTSSRITVPVSGLYKIEASLAWTANNSNSRYIIVRRNGSNLFSRVQTTYIGNSYHQSISKSIRLLAGDFIELVGRQNSGGALALDGSNMNYLEVVRIGNY